MKRSPLVLVALLLGLSSAPFPQGAASASCAAPSLDISEALVLERGANAVVEGRGFVDGCQDSMSCSGVLGCDNCEYDDPPPQPLEDVALRLVQRDRSWLLATSDAASAENDRQGQVSWSFEVPRDADPGRARLVSDHAQPIRIRIR